MAALAGGLAEPEGESELPAGAIYRQHLDGINRSRLGHREGIGAATVERYFRRGLALQFHEWHPRRCPPVMGIDEHFFTRRQGYATTICDLRNRRVYDVRLGRSEIALEPWLQRLQGKEQVRLVCMDLASAYRSLVRKHFPNARIVADRFHVIRLVNHHFLACWRELDPVASRHRGLVSLMRRHRSGDRHSPVVGVEPTGVGVSGGIRTLGHWSHNPALYQAELHSPHGSGRGAATDASIASRRGIEAHGKLECGRSRE